MLRHSLATPKLFDLRKRLNHHGTNLAIGFCLLTFSTSQSRTLRVNEIKFKYINSLSFTCIYGIYKISTLRDKIFEADVSAPLPFNGV